MGVKGLLPCLQSITRPVSLDRYRGLTAAVDAMSWLHKGVFACDVKSLARSQRNESENCGTAELRCVKYAMDKAETLRVKFGIEVLLVIDGDALPSKKEENAQRREDRDNAFEKALAAEKSGDSRAARRFFAQSCSVTHKIRYELIQACKRAKIAFIVAPYEADAQMARLAHTGLVDLVITEDSDTLCYGCPRILFKVDFDACQGQEIQLMRDLGDNESPSFKNWTHDMFVFMCILSGCDYCKGVPGIGIKLAHKIVRVHRSPSKIFDAMRIAGRLPCGFEDEFWIAFRTFRHQRVFCPSKQQIEPLFPIPGSNHDSNPMQVWPFLGEYIEPKVAASIADGTFHPSKRIAWEVALKGSINYSQSRSFRDIQIHHRSPPRKQQRKDAHSKQQGNIWHALVYGDDRSDCNARQMIDKPNRPSTKQSKDDMFRFFSESSKGNARKNQDSLESTDDTRPPLKEIYVDENSSHRSKSNHALLPPPPGHKDLPIHFHEYKSHLVGNKFKPITRLRVKRGNDGTKSTEVVAQIWERSSSRPQAPPIQEKCIEKPGGLAMFSRENNPVVSAPPQSIDRDDCFFTFTGRSNDESLAPTNELRNGHGGFCSTEHTSHERSRCSHGDARYQDFQPPISSYETNLDKTQQRQSSASSYYRKERGRSSFASDRNKYYATTSYHEKHDHHHRGKGQSSRHSPRRDSHHRTSEEALHSQLCPKQQHHSRNNDSKSFASGYTTIEPESFTGPSFPPELESDCLHSNQQRHDFGGSRVDVNIHTKEKHSSDCGDDHGSLGVFQVFHTQRKPRRHEEPYDCEGRNTSGLCFAKGGSESCDDSYNAGHEALFDLKEELANLPIESQQDGRDQLFYDDGLLMAFQEMHQL